MQEKFKKVIAYHIDCYLGNGHFFLLSMNGEKKLSVFRREAASVDVLTDLAFSPTNSRIFVTSSGNGKLVIHDINSQNKTELIAHTAEISSVEWNIATEILTGSWDGSIRLVRIYLSRHWNAIISSRYFLINFTCSVAKIHYPTSLLFFYKVGY